MLRIQTILLMILWLLPACASSDAWFAPREGFGAMSPDGLPAASYTLAREDGTGPLGRLRLWASATSTGDDGTNDLRVGFELVNLSDVALVLEQSDTQLIAVDVDESDRNAAEEARFSVLLVEGTTEAPPHGLSRGSLVFRLPTDLRAASKVLGFTIEWTVREVDGAGRFGDMTSFARIRKYAYRYPYPYGYPYWYDPWYGCYW